MSAPPPRLQAPGLAAIPGLAHGFFGRAGGVSVGLYESLNAGLGSGDDPEAVRENRRRAAAALGVAPTHLLTAYQAHTGEAVTVSGPWAGERPRVDGLATATPGLALGVLAADCAPVLLADPQARVIGAAHAGWRGAVGGVLEATVARMVEAGAAPPRIVAAIGPAIAQPSYEVGPDLEADVLAHDRAAARFFVPGRADRLQFDLPAYVRWRLAAAGVATIEDVARDTLRDEAFFSHRRARAAGAADYGRNLSAIAWVE